MLHLSCVTVGQEGLTQSGNLDKDENFLITVQKFSRLGKCGKLFQYFPNFVLVVTVFLFVCLFYCALFCFVFFVSFFFHAVYSNNESGHFFFFCHHLSRSFTNGQWYCFNDQSVTRVSMTTLSLQQTMFNSLYCSRRVFFFSIMFARPHKLLNFNFNHA